MHRSGHFLRCINASLQERVTIGRLFGWPLGRLVVILLVSWSACCGGRSLIPAVANHIKGVFAQTDRGNVESGNSSFKCCNKSRMYGSTESSIPVQILKARIARDIHDAYAEDPRNKASANKVYTLMIIDLWSVTIF